MKYKTRGNKQNIDRREFLKLIGGGAIAATASSCQPQITSNNSDTEQVDGELTYRTSSTTGDKIALLGYGCLRWPLLETPDEEGCIVDQDATNEMVDYAIEQGVNFFDTAPPYMRGWSERVMGRALSRLPRDKYFIATKLSTMPKQLWSREESIKLYKESFVNLKVDYIDYYMLHNIGYGGDEAFNARFIESGMIEYLMEERAAGRIRNLGFSFHGDVKFFDYLLSRHDEIKWDFVMIQINYKDWHYADETSQNRLDKNIDGVYLYGELEKRGIDAIIMEPLLGGRLANLPDYLAKMLLQERPHNSLASWAFRYAASLKNVICVLSGMSNLEHLNENLNTFSPLEWISDEENDLLMEVAKLMIEYPIIGCTTCQYCMPCPYGIDIPSIFSHYNKCVCEGMYAESITDDNYKEARRAFLIGYDRQVPKLRQADHCIGCKECEKHCPQKIVISKEMKRVSAYVEALKQNNFNLYNSNHSD